MTTNQERLLNVIRAEIAESDYSEPVTYVDVSAWARKCRWSVATTRGVYGSLIHDGLLRTDVSEDSLNASRAALLSNRDGGYEGCIPTCWEETTN